MKISEIIAKLEKIKEEHGDVTLNTAAGPCEKCFKEQHCELCGEKMLGLRWIVVDGTVYHACEICVGDFE